MTKEKIIETYNLDDYEIWTDTGWEDVSSVHKTIEYDVWRLELENGLFLDGADEHIVINRNGEEVYLENLKIGDVIKTIKGDSKVSAIYKTDVYPEHMYDITVDSDNHTFYSNGILSHNTTTVTIYALWLAIFFEFKSVAIVANKGDTAKQILSRIKLALEGLPVYLKPAIKSWRKDGVDLVNGSSIIISSTSVSSIRGSSITCLILDEMAHCQNDLMEELWKGIVPTISANKNGEIIAISTPNGADKDNKFYQVYLDSQKPNSVWVLIRVDWWDIPGRDEEWKQREIATLGSLHDFKQEYENCVSGECVLDLISINNGNRHKKTIADLHKELSQNKLL